MRRELDRILLICSLDYQIRLQVSQYIHQPCSHFYTYLLYFAESDYESIVIRLTFEAGLESEPPHLFIASILANDDSESESTEGFVLLLEVDEGSRDPRDRRRINIEESVFLVSIVDDGGKLTHTHTHTHTHTLTLTT